MHPLVQDFQRIGPLDQFGLVVGMSIYIYVHIYIYVPSSVFFLAWGPMCRKSVIESQHKVVFQIRHFAQILKKIAQPYNLKTSTFRSSAPEEVVLIIRQSGHLTLDIFH